MRSLEIHIHVDILHCLIIIYLIFHTHGLYHSQVSLPLSSLGGISGTVFLLALFSFFFSIFIEVRLIYNVVLVSGVQQSESVVCIHISTLF